MASCFETDRRGVKAKSATNPPSNVAMAIRKPHSAFDVLVLFLVSTDRALVGFDFLLRITFSIIYRDGRSSQPMRGGERIISVALRKIHTSDFLSLSFVFIYIPALFPRKVRSADRRFCGPRFLVRKSRGPEKRWSALPTPRLFVIVHCFHQHSGFVPSA